MKIAIRGGHNPFCVGASAIMDEVVEDRKIYAKVMEYLRIAGHTVIDVTPPPMKKQSDDLNYGIDLANRNVVDLFISIHFNKAYPHYVGNIGSEIWGCLTDKMGAEISRRILNNLCSFKIGNLQFKNRGYKDGMYEGLAEVKHTKMTGLIVEVCFLESENDVALYRQLGVEKIALAIAEGIHGGTIIFPESKPQPTPQPEVKTNASVVNINTTLNVRQTPGGRVVEGLKNNSKIEVLKSHEGWLNIKQGWVSKDYVKINSILENSQVVNISSYLNVRDKANGTIVDKLYNGNKVQKLAVENGFACVLYRKDNEIRIGWASTQYLK